MNKKLLILFLLSFTMFVSVTADQTIVRSFVNMTSNGINFNMTGEGSDNKWGTPLNCTTTIINGTSNTSAFCNITSFSKEYELLLIRSLSCNETDLGNLSRTCNEAYQKALNYENCTASKERVMIERDNYEIEKKDYQNKSEYCTNTYLPYKAQFDTCNADKQKYINEIIPSKDKEIQGAKAWWFGYILIGIAIGAWGYWFFKVRRNKAGNTPFDKIGVNRDGGNPNSFRGPEDMIRPK